jgi:hypothetical protein
VHTKIITVQEYATRYGCSPRFVQQNLNAGIGMIGMVTFRKAGNTWLIEVLITWYEQ